MKDLNATVSFKYKVPVPDSFVLVKAGTFTMGSPASEKNRWDNEKQHEVRISRDFYVSKYEVTQSEWESIMGTTVTEQKKKANPNWSLNRGEGNDYPMSYVSWYDAVEYCNKRSEREGLRPAYNIIGNKVTWNENSSGYRLPTEAEWEYAARGKHENRAYTIYSGSSNINRIAWYINNSEDTSHPVGGKQANELGIYDMSGNVWEWCWDWYDDYPTGSVTDPIGPFFGNRRVERGGSWWNYNYFCRSANRSSGDPSRRESTTGFRVVRLP